VGADREAKELNLPYQSASHASWRTSGHTCQSLHSLMLVETHVNICCVFLCERWCSASQVLVAVIARRCQKYEVGSAPSPTFKQRIVKQYMVQPLQQLPASIPCCLRPDPKTTQPRTASQRASCRMKGSASAPVHNGTVLAHHRPPATTVFQNLHPDLNLTLVNPVRALNLLH
jgi:hypothetical protein